MSKYYTMRNPVVEVSFRTLDQGSGKGGAFAIKGLAHEWGLWEKVRAEPALDRRTHKGKGFDPVVFVAAFVFGFATGGASMADFERLNKEEGLCEFLGIKRFPDASTPGEWLRAIDTQGVEALKRLNRDFIAWVLERAKPGRVLQGGDLELFFDDTQLEVTGKLFEEAKLNYEGKMTLSWQTLWVGPFVADGQLGAGSRECSECLPELMAKSEHLWKERKSCLYTDSGSSAGKYLELLEGKPGSYSVSYNKWTGGLDRAAAELPELAWEPEQQVRWRDGKAHRAQYAWLRYQPEGCNRSQLFAVTRHKKIEGELFWQYAFICTDRHRQQSARSAVERHQLKGDRERMFSQVPTDMDPHHPPCHSLKANEVFYALAMLAHNMLQAVKLPYLPDAEQSVRLRTLVHILMLIPVQFKRHARRLKAVCCVASNWLPWWRSFANQMASLNKIHQWGEKPG
jgi:hypothetical protein